MFSFDCNGDRTNATLTRKKTSESSSLNNNHNIRVRAERHATKTRAEKTLQQSDNTSVHLQMNKMKLTHWTRPPGGAVQPKASFTVRLNQ